MTNEESELQERIFDRWIATLREQVPTLRLLARRVGRDALAEATWAVDDPALFAAQYEHMLLLLYEHASAYTLAQGLAAVRAGLANREPTTRDRLSLVPHEH